jgi:chemotaxis protein methyltransferase CheR
MDIDQVMLAHARKGRYWWRSVRDVPGEYLDKYLIKEGESYTVRSKIASVVRFGHLNLHDRMAMRAMRDFDFIFCRNVLIYFDDRSRKAAVDHFYNSLNKGGYVFLGHSESVGRISSAFKLKRVENHLVYAKE